MRTYVLNPPWNFNGITALPGVTYDKSLKKPVFKGDKLPEMLLPFASQDYSWERWHEDDINGNILSPSPIAESSKMKPRPHQMEGAKRIASFAQRGYRGFLEADGVGLGKTITCLLGAYGAAKLKGFTPAKPAKVLIVCPKSVIPHWTRTIKALGIKNMRVAVINYDRTKSLLAPPASVKDAKKKSTQNKHIATKGTNLVEWDLIIADEAHKLKGIETSQRAKAFNRIGRYADTHKNAPFVIWATASPGQNPLEVGYMAPLVGQFVGKSLSMDKWGAYLESEGYHVSKSDKKGSTWSWVWLFPNKNDSPAEHKAKEAVVKKKRQKDARRMREILFDPKFPSIRRLPEDMADWPLIQRIPFEVEFEYSQKEKYAQAWSEFCSLFKTAKRGRDAKTGLVAQLRFRQKSSLIRVPTTMELVADLLENNQQVAVSVAFMDTIDAMTKILDTKKIPWAEVSGRTDLDGRREDERLRFQTGKARVVFFTVEEAISLHAGELLPDGTKASMTPRTTVVHDVRYSALSSVQIEGRCHRDKMKSNAYYMFAQGTVEEQIINRMLDRMATMKMMSGDDEELIAEIEQLLEKEAHVDA